jgi:hypothetical protein
MKLLSHTLFFSSQDGLQIYSPSPSVGHNGKLLLCAPEKSEDCRFLTNVSSNPRSLSKGFILLSFLEGNKYTYVITTLSVCVCVSLLQLSNQATNYKPPEAKRLKSRT